MVAAFASCRIGAGTAAGHGARAVDHRERSLCSLRGSDADPLAHYYPGALRSLADASAARAPDPCSTPVRGKVWVDLLGMVFFLLPVTVVIAAMAWPWVVDSFVTHEMVDTHDERPLQ